MFGNVSIVLYFVPYTAESFLFRTVNCSQCTVHVQYTSVNMIQNIFYPVLNIVFFVQFMVYSVYNLFIHTQDFVESVLNFSKLLLAAVNGPAVGKKL